MCCSAYMYEVGLEGDRFRPHLRTLECGAAGCVPVGSMPWEKFVEIQRSRQPGHDPILGEDMEGNYIRLSDLPAIEARLRAELEG